MKTYIVKSGKIYKIGRTNNVLQRMKSLEAGNPDIQLIKVYEGDYERQIHKEFSKYHYKLEWFRLSPFIIMDITLFVDSIYTPEDAEVIRKEQEDVEQSIKFSKCLFSTVAALLALGETCIPESVYSSDELIHQTKSGERFLEIKRYVHKPCNSPLVVQLCK